MTAAVLARAWVRVFMFRDMVWLGLMMIVIVELFLMIVVEGTIIRSRLSLFLSLSLVTLSNFSL